MSDQQKNSPQPAAASSAPEFSNPEFQPVLQALLQAYRPILEQEIDLSLNPAKLQAESSANPRDCAREFAEADQLFSRFFTEDVAIRLIPQKNREQIGPIENWRSCLDQVRCCFVFGWLVCRGPRTFRAWSYYVYQYWLCVRRTLGTPIADPPTEDQRSDFNTLIAALAKAYRPYLAGQLASLESTSAVPDEIFNGTIDCFEGDDEICSIFERLLTPEATEALFGKAAFVSASQENNFALCRCWSLCSLCFGCCLARTRTLDELLWCLVYYFRCLADCFRPLTCGLTAPSGCVEEQEFPSVSIFRGVEITGTATGFDCDHYILQWRQSGIGPWQSSGIVYPGGASVGACGISSGLLGYLNTFPLVNAGLVQIQLCVYASDPAIAPCCTTIDFLLQRNLVWINGIEGINAATPPGIFDPTAQLEDTTGTVRSFGTALRIFGTAIVGGCIGQTIKRYTLSYQPGFTTTLTGAWTQFWQTNYNTPLQDNSLNYVFQHPLTNEWEEMDFDFFIPFPPHLSCSVIDDYLDDAYWDTQNPQGGYPIAFPNPPVSCGEAPTGTWNSTPLALTNCQSGRYTLRLTVEDTLGGKTDNLRQAWFDNKNIYGSIAQIGTITPCATVDLSVFAPPSADCTVAWPAPLEGIAYDEYIEEGNFSTPSDNYGGYSLQIMKAGGGWHSIPIPGPGSSPWSGPFTGTSRIGDPGVRCPTAVPPPGPIPPATNGILARIDMRMLDSFCNALPAFADLVLQRATISPTGQILTPGECCGFIVHLAVWDTSICPSLSGDRHQADAYFPFCICNDLPPITVP